ncbi:DNA-binding NarL/FixJ family response regulator [Mycetocola sp. BIGb0189]|uniref:response regulator n=1 Tax=Mycetocola sp. BIGb0189 TaxID=2940604 RepID=UPI0021678BA1|nr:response regulator transcription factor [Mycetocola sp. BIGb0189]MCS4276588.1 DNA-binding NarL/FixJ family response regulator [Mycetocola sp. BIGb0189]
MTSGSDVFPAGVQHIDVLVIDDDPFVHTGVESILAATADLRLVGSRMDGAEVMAACTQLRPDVVLIDVRMPGIDGVTAVTLAQALPFPPQFVMMTSFDDGPRVVDAIAAGAAGFILKSDGPDAITNAIRGVSRGETALSPRSAKHLADWVRAGGSGAPQERAKQSLDLLSPRERDIAFALLDGSSNAEIGRRLFIADSTVKSTLQDVQLKLGARNRTEIAVLVARSGLER